jgi:hypothetical protein
MKSTEHNRIWFFAIVCMLIFLDPSVVHSQGPAIGYFYEPGLQLPFAYCEVRNREGERVRIPFLPLINIKGAPCGTFQYLKDVNMSFPLVLLQGTLLTGGQNSSAKSDDMKGNLVMFCYDCPENKQNTDLERMPVENQIREVISLGAKGVILYSCSDTEPSLPFRTADEASVPEIPLITINLAAAESILDFSGAGTRLLSPARGSEVNVFP